MQRSGYDENHLLKGLLLVGLILYEPLTTKIAWLPPLFGLAVWGLYRGRGWSRWIWLVYLCLYQIDHSIDLFLLFIALFITLKALDLIARVLACKSCLKYFGVVIFYGILMVGFWIDSTLFMRQFHISYSLVGLYLVLDLIVVGLYAD
ncbi:MAG: hypothetical protein C6H99_05075 [Epsilonproteobacteria bacterium]|nr:hypothetical protein [Campylobacterota bacterium]NPA65131.1 hypothetical protein [Campylobacterota bacterium]